MKKYYEAYDERYKDIHSLGLTWETEKHSKILDKIILEYKISKISTILELGCGEGRDAIYVLNQGYNLLATDISQEAIKYCKGNAHVYNNNFITLNACEDFFDK